MTHRMTHWISSTGVDVLASEDTIAPTALREAEYVKGSHRRLVVALAFLLVVAVASAVLAAQAKAGTGVGFGILKALAETGGSDAVPVAPSGMSGPGMSQCSDGGSCSAEKGASSCSMGKPEAKAKAEAKAEDKAEVKAEARAEARTEAAACSTEKPAADDGAKVAAASCGAEKDEACITCDQKDTCTIRESSAKAAAPDTK